MKPVDQIRTGFGRGQCTEASIASLLGVPLDEVPDLWSGAPDSETNVEVHQPQANRMRMWWWLQERHGVMLIAARLPEPTTVLDAWLRGVTFLVEDAGFPREALSPHHLAVGPNPDGMSHCVVALDGVVVHDPNPQRRGIVNARWVEWLVPLRAVPEAARGMPCAEWLVFGPS